MLPCHHPRRPQATPIKSLLTARHFSSPWLPQTSPHPPKQCPSPSHYRLTTRRSTTPLLPPPTTSLWAPLWMASLSPPSSLIPGLLATCHMSAQISSPSSPLLNTPSRGLVATLFMPSAL